MWILYLVLIVLGAVLVFGIYRYTRAHPEEESRARADFRATAEAAAPEQVTPKWRAPIPGPRSAPAADPTMLPQTAKVGTLLLSLDVRFSATGIPAAAVIETLRRLGFVPDAHRSYSRFEGDGTPLYSVANLFEPGILHPLPEDARLRGLAFFFESSPGAGAMTRLDGMLGAAQECARRFDGHLEDREHHPLTAARELELKLKAAGARGGR